MNQPMTCPRCKDQPLEAAMTRQGVEIDRCPSCQGLWLDRGEIFYFAKRPKPLIRALKEARARATEGGLLSPRTARPMLRLLVFAIPLPYLANELGWTLSEVGRQPWLVYNVMRTADGVSPLSPIQVAVSAAAFIVVYSLLGLADFYLLFKTARRGPHEGPTAHA